MVVISRSEESEIIDMSWKVLYWRKTLTKLSQGWKTSKKQTLQQSRNCCYFVYLYLLMH